jgi:hypothetical protein
VYASNMMRQPITEGPLEIVRQRQAARAEALSKQKAVHQRLQTIMNRLNREAKSQKAAAAGPPRKEMPPLIRVDPPAPCDPAYMPMSAPPPPPGDGQQSPRPAHTQAYSPPVSGPAKTPPAVGRGTPPHAHGGSPPLPPQAHNFTGTSPPLSGTPPKAHTFTGTSMSRAHDVQRLPSPLFTSQSMTAPIRTSPVHTVIQPVPRSATATHKMPSIIQAGPSTMAVSTQARSIQAATSAAATALATAALAAHNAHKEDAVEDKDAFKVFNLLNKMHAQRGNIPPARGPAAQKPPASASTNLRKIAPVQTSTAQYIVPAMQGTSAQYYTVPALAHMNIPIASPVQTSTAQYVMPGTQFLMPAVPPTRTVPVTQATSQFLVPAIPPPRSQHIAAPKPQAATAMAQSAMTFSCPYCQYSTVEPQTLYNHLISHGDSIDWVCPWCKKRHSSKNSVSKHIETQHPGYKVIYIPYGVPI